jgi:crotonobetainyl-CoA:carnitine CoA-transferase CaiB-like acyl-CoA transferase
MSSTRPLAGRIVVEVDHSIAAPYAVMVLGELGAEVIRVSPVIRNSTASAMMNDGTLSPGCDQPESRARSTRTRRAPPQWPRPRAAPQHAHTP